MRADIVTFRVAVLILLASLTSLTACRQKFPNPGEPIAPNKSAAALTSPSSAG